MLNPFLKLVKKTFNSFGVDIIRLKNKPRQTLLGLKSLNIQTIIDVGANQGQFANKIIKFFPNSNLFCFEPLPGPFNDLMNWKKKQNNNEIYLFNVAVGDTSGSVNINYHVNHSPSSSILPTTDKCHTLYPSTINSTPISIKMDTLDNLLMEEWKLLKKNILVKLDVQGYEENVIKGAENILTKATACIVEVCIEKLYKNQPSFETILNKLSIYGYKYKGNLEQIYDECGRVIYLDAVFIQG